MVSGARLSAERLLLLEELLQEIRGLHTLAAVAAQQAINGVLDLA